MKDPRLMALSKIIDVMGLASIKRKIPGMENIEDEMPESSNGASITIIKKSGSMPADSADKLKKRLEKLRK